MVRLLNDMPQWFQIKNPLKQKTLLAITKRV